MEFYIGGYAQGKLGYVLEKHRGQELEMTDGGETGRIAADTGKRIVLNHLHLLVKNLLEQGEDPEQYMRDLLEENPDCIVISDEIGSGIVPMERQEREYRERLGRIQIEIAAKAESVERVICGLGQKLK